MAIQFNCPYCTATIQVPDSAAGKKGTCPQCQTKLVVPTPKLSAKGNSPAQHPVVPPPQFAPSQPFPPPMPPAGGFPPPDGFAPQWGNPPPHAAPPFPPMPQMPPPGYAPMPGMNAPSMSAPQMFDPSQPMLAAQQPEPVASNPYAKKRKKSPGLTLWLSIGGAVLVIGGIVAFFVLSQKDNSKTDAMKGELTGIRLLGGKLTPAIVHRDWINLDEEVTDAMKEHLKKHKYNLKSELEQLQFQGTDEGIKVTITPGPGAELIAVEISEDKKLSKWHAKNSASLNEKAQKQVIASAKKFVKECV